MAEFWFQIDLGMPVAISAQAQRDIVVAIRPRWRVIGIEVRQLEQGAFRLKLTINSEGLLPEIPSNDQLREFRDLVVSLVAFSAMIPVQLKSKGIFDFPSNGNQRKQTSLGPMTYQFPAAPLSDLQPLVLGLALQPKYASALHFLWEALNSERALYRFLNLAVAVELLVRHDSPVRGSRHPNCGGPQCGYQLELCPKCSRSWRVPAQLRERAAFLLPPDILSKFVKARNEVFHGLSDELQHEYSRTLEDLNAALLLILRNYIGQQMGVPAITRHDLGPALNPPEIAMTVFYTGPFESEGLSTANGPPSGSG